MRTPIYMHISAIAFGLTLAFTGCGPAETPTPAPLASMLVLHPRPMPVVTFSLILTKPAAQISQLTYKTTSSLVQAVIKAVRRKRQRSLPKTHTTLPLVTWFRQTRPVPKRQPSDRFYGPTVQSGRGTPLTLETPSMQPSGSKTTSSVFVHS